MSLFDAPPSDPNDAPPVGPPPSPDPVCTVCGAPISWSGRGRRPMYCDDHKKSSSKSSSSSSTRRGTVSDRDLNAACDSLSQLYDMLVIPLAAVNPDAAGVWVSQVEGLNARNRSILANNRDLVKKINSVGERGGNVAFVFSHIFAVAPVAMVIVGQARVRAAQRAAEQQDQGYDATDVAFQAGMGAPFPEYTPDSPVDPDAAFRAG